MEFEQHGFEVHIDDIVIVAEAAYEFNRILSLMHYPSEKEVNETFLHIGLYGDKGRNGIALGNISTRNTALPILPGEAVHFRTFEIKFTPPSKRVKYNVFWRSDQMSTHQVNLI
ncbi:hypothetical protein C2G38_2177350 [Gigaspora rosea]|uniref:Uncharacterized protein n=1 Tax=Gigaspora rosea TaxID=44941 RepID=A0A397VFE8_9GLOM|nr:hypothetical protein C2G38_2177350 [Gigaspora rosea]